MNGVLCTEERSGLHRLPPLAAGLADNERVNVAEYVGSQIPEQHKTPVYVCAADLSRSLFVQICWCRVVKSDHGTVSKGAERAPMH